MSRSLAVFTLVLGLVTASGQARQTTSLADLKTKAEATGYKATSSYDDVVAFMKTVDAASPQVFYVREARPGFAREYAEHLASAMERFNRAHPRGPRRRGWPR